MTKKNLLHSLIKVNQYLIDVPESGLFRIGKFFLHLYSCVLRRMRNSFNSVFAPPHSASVIHSIVRSYARSSTKSTKTPLKSFKSSQQHHLSHSIKTSPNKQSFPPISSSSTEMKNHGKFNCYNECMSLVMIISVIGSVIINIYIFTFFN